MSTRQELLESRRLERLQNEARGYIPAVTLNKPVETFKSKSQPANYNIINGSQHAFTTTLEIKRKNQFKEEGVGVTTGSLMDWGHHEKRDPKPSTRFLQRNESQNEIKQQSSTAQQYHAAQQYHVEPVHAPSKQIEQGEADIPRKERYDLDAPIQNSKNSNNDLKVDQFDPYAGRSPSTKKQKEADSWSLILAAQRKAAEDKIAAEEAKSAAQNEAVAKTLLKQMEEHERAKLIREQEKRAQLEQQQMEANRISEEKRIQDEKRKVYQHNTLSTISTELEKKKEKQRQIDEYNRINEQRILERIRKEQEDIKMAELHKKEILKSQFEELTKMNEVALKQKSQQKELQKQHDVELMHEYARILEREEKKRKEASDKLRERQNQIQQLAAETHQGALGKQMEDEIRAKRYQAEVDAKQQRALDEKLAKAERIRENTKSVLSVQMQQKEEERRQAKEQSQAELRKIIEQNRIAEEKEKQKQFEKKQIKMSYKEHLLHQAEVDRKSREEANRLSEIERRLNARFLAAAQNETFSNAGRQVMH